MKWLLVLLSSLFLIGCETELKMYSRSNNTDTIVDNTKIEKNVLQNVVEQIYPHGETRTFKKKGDTVFVYDTLYVTPQDTSLFYILGYVGMHYDTIMTGTFSKNKWDTQEKVIATFGNVSRTHALGKMILEEYYVKPVFKKRI